MELLLKTQEEATLMSFSALGSGCGTSKDRHEGLSSKDPIRVSLAGDGTVGEEPLRCRGHSIRTGVTSGAGLTPESIGWNHAS